VEENEFEGFVMAIDQEPWLRKQSQPIVEDSLKAGTRRR